MRTVLRHYLLVSDDSAVGILFLFICLSIGIFAEYLKVLDLYLYL